MSDTTCKYSLYRVRHVEGEEDFRGERVADFVKQEDAVEYGEDYIKGDFTSFVIIERS